MTVKKFRLIPSVLYKNGSVVKSVQFSDHRIVGDLPSTMRVFSRRQADELIIYDLDASVSKVIDWQMVNDCVENCNMPLTYGGGVDSTEVANELIAKGFDKISINSALFDKPKVVSDIAKNIGSSSVLAVADILQHGDRLYLCKNMGKEIVMDFDLKQFSQYVNDLGVGELILNRIDADGMMTGYNFGGIVKTLKEIKIPVLVSGGCSGAGCIEKAHSFGFDGAVMSSIFLWKGDSIPSLKTELKSKVPVREVII